MVVNKILKLVNEFNPKHYELKRKYKYGLKIYECPVNIVYLIENKVYLGQGYVTGEQYRLSQDLINNNCKGVTFKYRPHLVCELEPKEKQIFIDLLKYEKKIFGNVKITSSYKNWIKNDIPYRLSCCNEEVYYTYEFRGANYYETKDNRVYVSVCFDNCDIELFQEYYINDTLENVQKDFDDWGNYDGKVNITKNTIDNRTIKI